MFSASKTEPTSTPNQLVTEARSTLHEQGIETTPDLVFQQVVAATPPRVLRKITKHDDSPTSESLKHIVKDLDFGPSRRTLAAGTLAGLSLGGAMLYGVGWQKYDMDKYFQDGKNKTMHVQGKQLFGRNTLVKDSSIMPGDSADSIPVVGSILRRIPGVPDYGRVVLQQTVSEKRSVSGKHITLASKYVAGRSKTGLAPNLSLNGSEYRIGRQTTATLLKGYTPKNLNINDISITGLASDDYRGKIGAIDPEQQQLAVDRARMTSKAVAAELTSEGFKPPHKITISGREAVLSTAQQRDIKNEAKPSGMTVNQAVNRYETKQKIPADLSRLLQKLITDNQGAQITVDAHEKKIETVHVLRTTPLNTESSVDSMPGEAIFTISALMGTLITTFYGFMLGSLVPIGKGRKAQRRAKKLVEKAGQVIEVDQPQVA